MHSFTNARCARWYYINKLINDTIPLIRFVRRAVDAISLTSNATRLQHLLRYAARVSYLIFLYRPRKAIFAVCKGFIMVLSTSFRSLVWVQP